VEKDGYAAAQLGFVEFVKDKRVGKPMAGHFKRADVAPARFVREVGVSGEDNVKAGDRVQADIFQADERVNVIGTSKGRGFAGVIKRHHFAGGRATHGSMFHRAPGSIGQSAYPSRVLKGVRMPGRMGTNRVTVRGLRIAQVDEERNLLFLKGAVPGPNGGYIIIRKAG
jgi:large subunit ribosomal protein L3